MKNQSAADAAALARNPPQIFERYVAQSALEEWSALVRACLKQYDDKPLCIGMVVANKDIWQIPVVHYLNKLNKEVGEADIICTHEFSSNCYIRFRENKNGEISDRHYYIMRIAESFARRQASFKVPLGFRVEGTFLPFCYFFYLQTYFSMLEYFLI